MLYSKPQRIHVSAIYKATHWFLKVCNIQFVCHLPEDSHKGGRNLYM